MLNKEDWIEYCKEIGVTYNNTHKIYKETIKGYEV